MMDACRRARDHRLGIGEHLIFDAASGNRSGKAAVRRKQQMTAAGARRRARSLDDRCQGHGLIGPCERGGYDVIYVVQEQSYMHVNTGTWPAPTILPTKTLLQSW